MGSTPDRFRSVAIWLFIAGFVHLSYGGINTHTHRILPETLVFVFVVSSVVSPWLCRCSRGLGPVGSGAGSASEALPDGGDGGRGDGSASVRGDGAAAGRGVR